MTAPLSQREREVVMLRRQGFLLKQIATRLGVSLGCVAKYLDRARRKGAADGLPKNAPAWRVRA